MKLTLPKIIHTLLMLGLLSISNISAQNWDSLERVTFKMKDDTNKINSIMKLVYQYRSFNLDKAIVLNRQAMQLAKKLNIKKKEVEYTAHLGSCFANLGQADSAMLYFHIAKSGFEAMGDKSKVAYILGNERYVHNFKGDFEKANECSFKALSIYENLKDKGGIATSYLDIGQNYLNQTRTNEAINFLKKSYTLFKELKYDYEIAVSTEYLSNCYMNMGKCDTALIYQNESYAIRAKSGSEVDIAQSFLTYAKIYKCKGEIEKAISYTLKSRDLFKQINYWILENDAIQTLGELYLAKKNYKQAIESFQKNIKYLNENEGILTAGVLYGNIANAYAGLNQYDSAYHYKSLEKIFNDSLINDNTNKQLSELQTKYETAKKENQIAQQTNLISQQKSTLWIIGGVFALALIGGFFYYNRNKFKQQLQAAETHRLKELDTFKNKFFTNISHEFRTPLTVIQGISEDVAVNANSDLKSKMNLIHRSGQNLLRLINQILDLSKLEAKIFYLKYEEGDIIAYVKYIFESLYSLASPQNIKMVFDSKVDELIMPYDSERIMQILHNLLSNSIKFSQAQSTVKLSIEEIQHNNQRHLKIKVADEGVGIPADELPYVFDRFYQANNMGKSKSMGTGIGLALTKELVTMMKGDISVESKINEGTTFTVLLPIQHGLDVVEQTDKNLQPSLTSPSKEITPSQILDPNRELSNLLIIEDNTDVVEYLAGTLQSHFNLTFAYNGQSGINKALEFVPDIILSDVMMPEKDGFEVLDALKNDQRTSHIPIVMLSAKADIESKLTGLKYGADSYLAKPFNKEELLVTLQNLIDVRKKLQSKYAQYAMNPTNEIASNVIKEELAKTDVIIPVALEHEFLSKLHSSIEPLLSDSNLDVDKICQMMGVSRTNLFTKLKALTGQSITLYIRKLRLAKSKELLATTEMTVAEVAYSVGFNDPKYFTRVFTEEYGESPKETKGRK